MRADIDRWNRKYAGGPRSVEPAGEPELAAAASALPGRGLALELACGRGANALFLARLGYQVVAVDCAINGLGSCRRTARRLGLPVFPVVMDLDRAALPHRRFRLVCVVRYLNRPLFPVLAEALAPGGVLFYKTFNRRHLEDHPGFNPGYVLEDGELDRAFAGLGRLAGGESGTTSWILARAAP